MIDSLWPGETQALLSLGDQSPDLLDANLRLPVDLDSDAGGNVQIIMQGQNPPPGYLEIAVVQSQGTGTKAKMPLVLEALKEKAAQLGGNAVINVRIDQGTSNVSASGVAVYLMQPAPQ